MIDIKINLLYNLKDIQLFHNELFNPKEKKMSKRSYYQGPGVMELYRILTLIAAEQQPNHVHILQVKLRSCPRGRAPFYVLFKEVSTGFFHKSKEIPIVKIDAAFYETKNGKQVCLRTFEQNFQKPIAHKLQKVILETLAPKRIQSVRIY